MKNLVPYRLSDCIIPNQQQVSINPFDDYKQVKLRLYQNGVELRGMKKGNELGSKQFIAREGQFIISKIDARNGAMGIVPGNLNGAVVTGDFLLFDFNDQIIDGKYFDFYTRLNSFDRECKFCSEGSTNRVRLKVDKFLNISIILPLLSEQQRIVSKIERVKQRIELIKSLRAEQEKDFGNLRFSLFEKVKEEFGVGKVGDLIKEELDFVSVDPLEEYLFAGVFGFGKGLFVRGIQKGNDTTYKTFNRLHENNIVMSQPKGWEGAITLVTEEFEGLFLSPVYSTFTTIENNNIKYVAEFCKLPTTWQKMLDVSKGIGARRNSIYANDFLKLEIPFPPIEEQNRIVSLLNKLNAVKANHTVIEKELTDLMPALMDKAFKGEL